MPRFVIQQHHATSLHFDFRLEVAGTFKSWAVPKGPSTDPRDKRLAMAVDDHSLGWGDFEGVIPAGEYGAGTVEIWDRGTYDLLEEKRDGGLTVRLHGERLDGVWTLVPARLDGDPKNWLLLRKDADDGSGGRYEPMKAVSADTLPVGDGWVFGP
jgi:bifunctional non-homologous end joining protein LigD